MSTTAVGLKRPLSSNEKKYALSILILPSIATVYVLFSGMLFSAGAFTLGLLVICYVLCVIGITIGFHRLLTHRSFEANEYLRNFLVILGCMATEGPPFFWIAAHRRHHKYTDQPGDPHSANDNKKSIWENWYHSHMGWMISHTLEDWRYYILDLLAVKSLCRINRHYLFYVLLGIILPGIINGLYYGSFYHVWEGIMICGFFRIFLQHHVTWSINSYCHIFGRRDFDTADNSRNSLLFGFLALGEGWHNGHHAFPTSAKHGLLWWQVDASYLFIKFFSLLGLAKKIKVPSQEKVNNKLIVNTALSKE